MRIRLSGYNVDRDVLEDAGVASDPRLTPETFSAGYARISRSPLTVSELRRRACRDVEQARRSNRTIIFAMGHHSVAEHAVFNFDVMGVSRLALEELEQFRLASYTEKSQRYVTLDGDFVTPGELRDRAERDRFRRTVARLNGFYRRACARLEKELEGELPERRERETLAKEDARYALPLATCGQVGLTLNARSLEHLFRRFALSPRLETRRLGQRLHRLVMPVAPSLILFAEPSPFEREVAALRGELAATAGPAAAGDTVVEVGERGDDEVLAAFLAVARGVPPAAGREQARAMPAADREALFCRLFRVMEFFDAPPREFELAEITVSAAVSAACFAQLKRHRMATLLAGAYRPGLGLTVPPRIAAAGLEAEFRARIAAADLERQRLASRSAAAADYLLTNAHRRSVLLKMNLRELYHFVRLRDDAHAQWDIRALAAEVAARVREKMPLAARLLFGKSRFGAEFERIFGRLPQHKI